MHQLQNVTIAKCFIISTLLPGGHYCVMQLMTKCLMKDVTSSPKRVQNMPPRMGSGKEANRAVNFPTVPRTSIIMAPYWTTLLLPTYLKEHTSHAACSDMREYILFYTITHTLL